MIQPGKEIITAREEIVSTILILQLSSREDIILIIYIFSFVTGMHWLAVVSDEKWVNKSLIN